MLLFCLYGHRICCGQVLKHVETHAIETWQWTGATDIVSLIGPQHGCPPDHSWHLMTNLYKSVTNDIKWQCHNMSHLTWHPLWDGFWLRPVSRTAWSWKLDVASLFKQIKCSNPISQQFQLEHSLILVACYCLNSCAEFPNHWWQDSLLLESEPFGRSRTCRGTASEWSFIRSDQADMYI